MSENQLMDKLVAEFNDMYRKMQSRNNELDSQISTLNHEKKDIEDGLAKLISSIKELEQKKEDWLKKYDNARIRGTQSEEDYAYDQWERAKNILEIENKVRDEEKRKLNSIINSLSYCIKERDALQKRLGNISSLSAEAKGETYYRWLLEEKQAAKSENEFAALAIKFSKISGYKDCAKLAEECKTKVIELRKKAEEDRKKKELDKELDKKLKPLDADIDAVKKEIPSFDFKKTLKISSIIVAALVYIDICICSIYRAEFAMIFIGIPVVAVLCRWWKYKTGHAFPGFLFWLCLIYLIIKLIAFMDMRPVISGYWLLNLLVGTVVSTIVSFLYKKSKKQINLQKLAILEKTKADLCSEYEIKIEKLIGEFQEKAKDCAEPANSCETRIREGLTGNSQKEQLKQAARNIVKFENLKSTLLWSKLIMLPLTVALTVFTMYKALGCPLYHIHSILTPIISFISFIPFIIIISGWTVWYEKWYEKWYKKKQKDRTGTWKWVVSTAFLFIISAYVPYHLHFVLAAGLLTWLVFAIIKGRAFHNPVKEISSANITYESIALLQNAIKKFYLWFGLLCLVSALLLWIIMSNNINDKLLNINY